MNISLVNWLAVVAAGLSAFVIGGIWYSRSLFGNACLADSNITEDQIKQGNKWKIFGFTAIFSLTMAANLAMLFAQPTTTAARVPRQAS